MHILIIPSWYKTEQNPVLGSFFEEQARGLQSLGNTVGLMHIAFNSYSSKEKQFFIKKNDEGLNTIQFNVKAIIPRNRSINYWYLGLVAIKKMEEYIKLYGKPDVIHAHSVFWGGIATYYISKKLGIPYIITEHSTSFFSKTITNSVDIKYSQKIFEHSKANIVVSESFKKELSNLLSISPKKFHVVNNMVSPLFFENRKENVIEKNKPLVFFTNSFLTCRKNHLLIINAFALFIQKYPNSILYIGGESTNKETEQYKKKLIQSTQALKLSDKIIFLGSLSRKEVKLYLDKCHIFLLASVYETFGVVLIEALAAGRPIITTDSKGPKDIVNPQNGLLVNEFDEKLFCNSMLYLAEHYHSYHQENISKDCAIRFSEKTIMTKIQNIYDTFIQGQTKATDNYNLN